MTAVLSIYDMMKERRYGKIVRLIPNPILSLLSLSEVSVRSWVSQRELCPQKDSFLLDHKSVH